MFLAFSSCARSAGLIAVLFSAVHAFSARAATLVADYRLESSLKSSIGSAPEMKLIGGPYATFVTTNVLSVNHPALILPPSTGLSIDTSGLLTADQYSIALVVALDATDGYQRIADTHSDGSVAGWFVRDGHMLIQPAADPAATGSHSITAKQFFQIVLTRSGTTARAYVNGALDLTFNDTQNWTQISTDGVIKFLLDTTGQYGNGGKIARIRLYNGALTDAEAGMLDTIIPAAASQPSGATVAADYRFEDTLKSSVNGAPDLVLDRVPFAQFVQDNPGGGNRTVLDFGSGGGVHANVTGLLDPLHYSVVLLFDLATVSGYAQLFDVENSGGAIGAFNLNGTLGVHPLLYTSDTLLTDRTYAQVTYAVDGQYVRIYRGGTKVLDLVDPRQSGKITADNIWFFLQSNGSYAPGGRAARIRLFNGALSDADVAALAPLEAPAGPGNSTPPAANADYRFEESLKSTASGAPDMQLAGKNVSFVMDTINGSSRTALQFEPSVGLDLNTAGLLDPNHYTVSMMFRLNDVVSYHRIFDPKTPTETDGPFVNDGLVGIHPAAYSTAQYMTGGVYAAVTVVKDGIYERIYVDGTKALDIVDSNSYATIKGDLIHFFRNGDGQYDNGGRVARIRTFNTVLNDAQVAALDVLAPPTPPISTGAQLIADYQFRGNFQSSVPGAPDIIPSDTNGVSFETSADLNGQTVLHFNQGQGLQLATKGLLDPEHYSVALAFELDNTSGYGWLLNAKDSAAASGWFTYNNGIGDLPTPYATRPLLGPAAYIEVVLVTDGQQYRVYSQGRRELDFFDPDENAAIGSSGLIDFFRSTDGSYAPGGHVARVRVFNGALSDSEVSALAPAIPSVELTQIPPGANVALAFNGGYLDVPATNTVKAPFTVEFWAFPSNGGVLGSRQPAENGFDVKFTGNSGLHGDIGNGTGWLTTTADYSFPEPVTNWVHVAYVVQPDSYIILLNGAPVATNTLSDLAVLTDPSHQLRIGTSVGGELLSGQLDEVRIWNRARAAAEIAADYKRALRGDEPGLIHYFSFCEGRGDTVPDHALSSGNDAATFSSGGTTIRWVSTGPQLDNGSACTSGNLADWNAARDLRANESPFRDQSTQNPNPAVPVWSYGYRLESALASSDLTLFTSDQHYTNIAGSSSLYGWYRNSSSGPTVAVNVTDQPVTISFCCGPLVPITTDDVAVWPGSDGAAAIARWTAPSAGDYQVSAHWHKTDIHGGNGCTRSIVVNGSIIFSEVFSSTADGGYTNTLHFAAGDKVDFALGPNGEYSYDGSAFNAIIAPLSGSSAPPADLIVQSIQAPGGLVPGVPTNIVYTVLNQGSGPANGPWSDVVYLAPNPQGTQGFLLDAFLITNTISSGASLTLTQQVTLPANGPNGTLYFVVTTDSGNAVNESNENNNSLTASSSVTIPGTLTLSLSDNSVPENTPSGNVAVTVSRNGDVSSTLSVTLQSSDPNRASVPQSVVIPAGRASVAVFATFHQDGLLTGPKAASLSASAAGFQSAKVDLTILDSDLPALSLSLAPNRIAEGASATATLSRQGSTNDALTVNLSGPVAHLNFPTTVTVPAGKASVTFAVGAVDDTTANSARTSIITASASGFVNGTGQLIVDDNDVPNLSITLARSIVSEGDGPQATTGTITRDKSSPQDLVVNLTSGNTNVARVPATVTIPGGETSAVFNIAAVDNNVLDGDKQVAIGAMLLEPGTGLKLADAAPVSLRVTDDDGPTLKLTLGLDVVAEGATPATTATLSRNGATSAALTATLTSSDTVHVKIPASVVIPAGAASVSFPINTVKDAVQAGNQAATISAAATGFTGSSRVLIVSDSALPDLVIGTLTLPAAVDSDTFFQVGLRVENHGPAESGTNFTQRVYLSSDPLLSADDPVLIENTFPGSVAAGGFYEQRLQARSPQAPGDYWVIAVADADNAIAELSENNNTTVSATTLHVRKAYGATVVAGLKTAPANTPVPLHGQATLTASNAPAAFVTVDLTIRVRETERHIAAITDASGNYSTTFQPLPNEGGIYAVAADYPGITNSPTQATFTLLGMNIDPFKTPVRVGEGLSVLITNEVDNLADSPLSGLSTTVVSAPNGVLITPSLSSAALAASGNVQLNLQISAAAGAASGNAVVRVKSAEGITYDFTVPVSVELARARLVASTDTLEAGMRRGGQTTVTLVLTNTGTLPTGPLSVLIPPVPWMKVSSGTAVPSLAPNDAVTISLLLTPAPDLDLGPYTGTIVVKSDSTGISIPYTFRNLSDALGNFVFEAVDEYTYYASGSPKVTNALVTIRDSVTKDLVLTNSTGADGTLVVKDLREAYYDIEVTADGHSPFKKTGLLQAGKDNQVTAFLSRQTVRYIFSVVPTEIEDRTKIVITTEFETFVPIPVVTADPPYFDLSSWSGTTVTQVNVTLSNHGLLAANNMRLALPAASPEVEFTSLISSIGDLPAQSSITVPILIKPGSGLARPGALHALSAGGCYHDASFSFDLVCGPQVNTYNVPLRFDKLPGCPDGPPTVPVHFEPWGQAEEVAIGQGLGGWESCPWCEGPGPFSFGPPLLSLPIQNCNPCILGAGVAALCIAASPAAAPIEFSARCLLAAATCAGNLSSKGVRSFGTAISCVGVPGACNPGKASPAWAIPACLLKAGACLPPALGGFGLGGGGGQKSASPGLLSALSVSDPNDQTPPEALPLVRQLSRAIDLIRPLTNYFGNIAWLQEPTSDQDFTNWFNALSIATSSNSPASYMISDTEMTQLMSLPVPVSAIQPDDLRAFVARWNRTVDYYQKGIFDLADVPAGQSTDFIALDVYGALSSAALAANDAAVADGYSDAITAAVQASQEFVAKANSAGGGSCAHVKLEIDQQAVITRDAFNATLEIDNDTDDTLSNVSIDLVMHNGNGDDTTQTFFVRPPVLQGLTATDGTGQIAPHSNGKASWILVPTSDAAPDGPVTQIVGGTLRYQQGTTQVTIPLIGQSINVLPNAALTLRYFHQRDVFADDPFTDEIEPSIPYSLAVMIQNTGKGVAKDVHITSAQPKIVDNQKGLLIDFSIIATDVDGQPLSPSLTAAFGDINPGEIKIGRWLLKSTLQGLFTDYSASFENIDGLGDKKVALIQNVEIHEMDHIVQADRTFEDGHPDFLANDVPDFNDYPDTLYFSQGTNAPVTVVTNATPSGAVSADQLTVALTASMPAGWTYLRVAEPSDGQFHLIKVQRPDGSTIALDTNVWVTDRTFIGFSQKPVRENILHLLDYNTSASSVGYQLTYEPAAAADSIAPSSSVSALPASSSSVIPVTWHGSDNDGGSGIAYYDIYVSVNGGAFQLWLTKNTGTGALYNGDIGSTYAFYSVATDLAGNHESAHVSADATTSINLVNTAPVLTVAPDQTIDEGMQVVLNNSATDSDVPANTLTFSLGAGAPAGAQIDPASGRVTWNTSEATGPSTNKISVIVRDNGQPSLSATGMVTVVVREVNTAPVIQVITNSVIDELQVLRFQVNATDADIPTNTLTFTLVNPPRGATISASGQFNWRPDNTQGPSTNNIQIKVTDNGTPPMSATQQFSVIVLDTEGDFGLAFDSLVARTGGDYAVNLNINSGLDLNAINCALELNSDRLANLRIEPLVPELASAAVVPSPSGGYFLQLQAAPGQTLTGNRAIATLRFDAGTSQHSEIVYLDTQQTTATRASNQATVKGQNGRGRVVLIGNEPLMAIHSTTQPMVELFGLPGKNYMLQQSNSADPAVNWPTLLQYQLTNLTQTMSITPTGRMKYYRVQE